MELNITVTVLSGNTRVRSLRLPSGVDFDTADKSLSVFLLSERRGSFEPGLYAFGQDSKWIFCVAYNELAALGDAQLDVIVADAADYAATASAPKWQAGVSLAPEAVFSSYRPAVVYIAQAPLQFTRVYSNGGLTMTETATPASGTPSYTRVVILTVANDPGSWSQIGRWAASDASALPPGLITLNGQPLTLNGLYVTFNPA
jgi:hypothetical protein